MSGGTETGGDPDSPKNVEKINKRHSGIMKAADKLKKEEVEQIDELSKTTTANYLYHAKVDKNYVHGGDMGKYAKARDKGIKRAEKKLGKKVSDRVNYLSLIHI